MNFTNDIVLVTGSSRGIGKAIAYAFARCGAKVILNGATNEARLRTTYETFLEEDLKAIYYYGDISRYHIAEEIFKLSKEVFGDYPTIIINNAGISFSELFTDTTPDMWHTMMNSNLNSAYNCCHIGVPHMLSKHAGTIINISSIWGNVGASCEVAYSTSKSALNGFTRSLAKELGPSNIRVNAIACGWIDTDMTKEYSEEDKAAFIEEIPLCRTGHPDDVAKTCLYLASELSSYMTGQVLTLDGGLL